MVKQTSTLSMIMAPLFALSLVVLAQQPIITVGDLLGAGGRKLTRDEIHKVVTDATVSGVVPANPSRQSEMNYKKDGSASGRSSGGEGVGSTYGLSGTWTVNDQGQFCLKVNRSTDGADRSPPCFYWFVLNERYYTTSSDEKTSRAFIRDIKR